MQLGADWYSLVQLGPVKRTFGHGEAYWFSLLNVGAVWCNLMQIVACWCTLVYIGAVWCNLVQFGAN